MKAQYIYKIHNVNFTAIYNKLSVFDRVVFKEADTINHIYTASLYLWSKVLHVKNSYLYKLKTEFKVDDLFIIQTINNIINYNLIGIDINTKLSFMNETKALKKWSLSKSFPVWECLYIYYSYGPDVLQKVLFTDNINNTYKAQWKSNGILITYNHITNNISGWVKLMSDISAANARYLLKFKPDIFFKKLGIESNNNHYFNINGICATYKQWSLFINKPRTYLEDMEYAMGRKYTYNFLYTTVVDNIDFITRNKEITINNESLTLYGWAKKLHKNRNTYYALAKNHGIDYAIKILYRQLDKCGLLN